MCQALDPWIARAFAPGRLSAATEALTQADAGADPAVVTQWINEAQRDKDAAQKKLDARPAVTWKRDSRLDPRQLR